ncbi:MAG: type II toxin-antitoxin system VapC family toxin [Candidatus Rokubacteria bacterium]|nr:type II toxin-antitoxin system VapC family toxin [Candidatus Rokubacteria bacterium]
MPGRVLLDTTVIIALFNGDRAVVASLSEVTEVFAPSIAVGELFYGAIKSGQAERNIRQIRDFVRATAVLPVTASTAETYGRVKDRLRQQGRPIPENDIWIAAVALEQDLDLATRDTHFGAVAGLRLQTW